ncbi:hypothetical protein ACFV9P_03865 [Streptomyces sp. NPDC059892]|uniref:hypothetical protein n=1 Tax=unclassified Streptomyces TaxID=2593676 RepID=UPI0036558976
MTEKATGRVLATVGGADGADVLAAVAAAREAQPAWAAVPRRTARAPERSHAEVSIAPRPFQAPGPPLEAGLRARPRTGGTGSVRRPAGSPARPPAGPAPRPDRRPCAGCRRGDGWCGWRGG